MVGGFGGFGLLGEIEFFFRDLIDVVLVILIFEMLHFALPNIEAHDLISICGLSYHQVRPS